jgi:hypothetical protein
MGLHLVRGGRQGVGDPKGGRIGLVIGNGAYEHLPRLANPTKVPNLSRTLCSRWVQVDRRQSPYRSRSGRFEHAIRDFGAQLPDGPAPMQAARGGIFRSSAMSQACFESEIALSAIRT